MIGKVLYGSLFCIVLPLLLVAWASNVTVDIPVGDWIVYGWILFTAGVAIMITAMHNLYHYGGGLPMNAFPPPAYVTKGAYRFLKHPIYVAFCMICAGCSCIAGSASGLYLITPIVALLCIALVLGYEAPDLEKRFGVKKNDDPVAGAIILFAGWAIFYELAVHIGYNDNYFNTRLPFERAWTVVEIAEIPYALTYFSIVVPFLARSRESLSSYVSFATFMVAGGAFIQLVFPFYCSALPFSSQSLLGDAILFERAVDSEAAAFPSFHAIWILISAWFLSVRFPQFKIIVAIVAMVMLWSCLATGVHSTLDILAAVFLFVVCINRQHIWKSVQAITEKIANSWTAVHVGGMRIINHAVYPALAAFVGVMITGQFIHDAFSIAIIAICSMLGAIAWGQWIEGGVQMLRPLGYFGSILGGIAGIGIVSFSREIDITTLLAAIALAAPWTQAIGRLRCLVQGCCHGRPASVSGIRYFNPHSRVHSNPSLTGKVLHNTQLYSIIANIIAGLILARLKFASAPDALIAGLYFILTGVSRFVEEAYRGEEQTRIVAGLRIYQWLSILSLIVGCVLTTVPSGVMPPLSLTFSWPLLTAAVLSAIAWAFGMSVDFPRSNAPFARLTG